MRRSSFLCLFLFSSGLLPACGGQVIASAPSDGSVGDGASDTPVVDTGSDLGIDRTCSMAGMCVLVPASCCGNCGMPTKTDEIAIPRNKWSAYRTLACTTDGGAIACPECAGTPDPNLQAFCEGGTCVPVFVPTDPISACASDADCQLVQGVCCGPCGGERTLTAVAKTRAAEFTNQICDPTVDCAGCPMPVPTLSKVKCDPSTKHCVVVPP
jgi:hypothetical protein